MVKDSLRKFLKASRNSVSREVILRLKFVHDLKVAAAARNYDLRVFMPDVDREGYDLVLDDGDDIRKYQIKSVFDSKKSSWVISKNLFRLPCGLIEKFKLVPSPLTEGVGGGFVLLLAKVHNADLALTYFYTDIYVILSMQHGLLKKYNLPSQDRINLLLEDIFTGSRQDKVKITKSFLVNPRGKEELLALMGMHSRIDGKCWINNLIGYLSENGNNKKAHQKVLEQTFSKMVVS